MNAREVEKYTEEALVELIDEVGGDVTLFGMTYSASRVLAEVDPIAYRCLCSDLQEYEYECDCCGERFEDEADAEACCAGGEE